MAKKDYNLIYLKTENARISLKELSRQLKKSPQRLKYSLSVLEKEELIKAPYCIIDYSFFGQILFRTYFKGGYIQERDKARTIKELSDNPYITSIYELTGEFDLCVEFLSPNPSKFNKELKRIATIIPTLQDYKIVLNLVTHIYPKAYLIKSAELQAAFSERIVGGDRSVGQFTENEMSVIKSMVMHPIARYRELAERSGLNIKTVKSIMKSLKQRHIMKGFGYIIDTEKAGIYKSRLFLKLHNMTIESEALLLKHIKNSREIVQVNKTIGDWDMELDIGALDPSRTRAIIVELRENFKDLIERFNIIGLYRYYKVSYIPKYIFEEEEKQGH